jgi:hypothetical protein
MCEFLFCCVGCFTLTSIDQKIDPYSGLQGHSNVDNNNPDLVYLDVLIANIQQTTTAPPILNYQETKTSPFLKNPGDYQMSIIKFQLSSRTLPVITPIIEPTSTDPKQTIYKITMTFTYLGTTYTQTNTIMYSPQISSIPIPSKIINQQQDNTQSYYNVYSYTWWLSLINSTFQDCFDALNTQITGAGGSLPTTNPPVITFDSSSKLSTLNADILGYNDASGNYISIYFNLPLFNLFAFPFSSVNYNNNILTAKINTNSFSGNNVSYFPPATPPQYQALQIIEEYVNLSAWSPVQAVVVTTSSIPIIAECLPTPTLYNNGSVFSNTSQNQNQDLVITDFTSDDGTYTSSFLYVPSGEYRMISMQPTTTELRNIFLSVKYLDRFGNYNPVRLNSGGSANLKFLFRKIGSK